MWVQQTQEAQPNQSFEQLVLSFKSRFEDRNKSQKAYVLLGMRQGKKGVREFNREFNEVLLEVGVRPAEDFLLNTSLQTLE